MNDAGDCWIAGETQSPDFPVVEAVQPEHGGGSLDGFVLKLSSDGSRLLASTYVGGSDYDEVYGLALGPSGDNSNGWPVSDPELVLEATATLGTGAVWEPVPMVPETSGTQDRVTVRAEGSASFYRLREP